MGQRPLLCPLHGARCDATPARTCITMSRYEAQYGTGGLIPASTLTLIIPESSSDLYEDLLSLPPSVPTQVKRRRRRRRSSIHRGDVSSTDTTAHGRGDEARTDSGRDARDMQRLFPSRDFH